MAERRYTEQETALEIKSLRRIIAAYFNYQDAAEKDVKRYERSFKKLSPAHKKLLFHLGLKYQRLRWCISMNASFVMNMLEAFDPPFDMSQNEDGDCHDCVDHMHGHDHAEHMHGHDHAEHMHVHDHVDCAYSSERADCSRSVVTMNNSTLHAQNDCPREDVKSNECCGETGNKKDGKVHMVGCSQHAVPNLGASQDVDNPCIGGEDAIAAVNYQDTDCFASSTDENVRRLYCKIMPGKE